MSAGMKGDRRLTRDQASRLKHWRGARDKSLIWIVTWNTRDYPWQAVARPHLIDDIGIIHPLKYVLLADSTNVLRELLPPGLVRISRDPFDDPSIMETWV